MRNFNLERFVRELKEKEVINEEEASFFIETFWEFPFKPSIKKKKEFFQIIKEPEDCEELQKKIWEARKKAFNSKIKIKIIAQSFWLDSIIKGYSYKKRMIFKKIYLFIIENTE